MRHTPSSRRRLKAIGQRENRWMQDINHQVSKALVENNPKHTLFVLEDLSGIRNATERVKTKDRYVYKLVYRAYKESLTHRIPFKVGLLLSQIHHNYLQNDKVLIPHMQ